MNMKKYLSHSFVAVAFLSISSASFAQDEDQPRSTETPSTASAAPIEPLSFEEMLVLDGKSYAKLYGVGLEEGMRRVLVMNDTTEAIDALSGEFAGKIGGQYFTHGADFGLKMRLIGSEKQADRSLAANKALGQERQAARQAAMLALRDPQKAARISARRATLGILDTEVKLAEAVSNQPISAAVKFLTGAPADRNSVEQSITAKMADIQSQIPSLDSVAYDERRGSVVISFVGTSGSVTAAARTAIAAMFPTPVVYQHVPQRLGTTAATGGTANYLASGDPWCTNGFVGYDSANTPGIFSASHCRWSGSTSVGMFYKDGSSTTNLFVDPNLSAWTTHGDMLFLTLSGGLSPSPYFFADNVGAARLLTGRRTMATTVVKSGTTAGSMICFYGRTTGPVHGQSCGEVVAKGLVLALDPSQPNMTAGSGTSYYVAVQAPSATMKCQGGDSGAPWFALSIAWGTMSRCSENWIGTDSYAIYTSMDAAYAKSYRLAY